MKILNKKYNLKIYGLLIFFSYSCSSDPNTNETIDLCQFFGDSISHEENGVIKEVKYFQKSELYRCDYYYCNRLMNISYFSEGFLNGPRIEFNEDGSFYWMANYVNDTVDGIVVTYYQKLELKIISEYDMGKLMKSDTLKYEIGSIPKPLESLSKM